MSNQVVAVQILRYSSEKAGPPHEIDVPFQRVRGVQLGLPHSQCRNKPDERQLFFE